MNRITEHLTDPGWWFTAVFVAVLVSLAAAFLKDALLTALAKVSKYYRTRKKQRDEEVEKQVNLILNDPILFILSYSKIIFQTSAALTLTTIYSVMYGLYISLPEGVNIKAKLILGFMTILSGAGAIFTILRHYSTAENHKNCLWKVSQAGDYWRGPTICSRRFRKPRQRRVFRNARAVTL